MSVSLLLVPFAVWGLCAVHDVTSFKIPNRYVLFLMASWPVAVVLAGAGMDVATGGLLVGAALLLGGFCLFAAGLLGAGDAKLIAASGLWIGPQAILPFVLYTTLFGAALGLLLLALRAVPLPVTAARIGWVARLHERQRVMPYGVAIAAGGMLALPSSALIGG